MEYNLLIYSSLIFITNAITACYKKYYIYSLFFVCLIITSFIFHSNNNIYTNILDKFAILAIVIYASYILYNKIYTDKHILVILILITFILSIFLFYYGYCTNSYCYDPDKCIGDKYHCLLHFISSIGHHFIIFL